jgi:hypothetical protein
MRWKKIDNPKRVQNKGKYTDWKAQISDDCFNQCVYCSIHEGPWGGIDHYHIDHFRPQFSHGHLTHVIHNLYHCCPVCNKFKSKDWPNEPDNLDKICYPDPGDHNYSDLFVISPKNYTLSGKNTAASYVINRLYLNRPQLIYERREHFLQIKAKELIAETKILMELSEDLAHVKKAALLIANITIHLQLRNNVPPYKLIELKKVK